jgi:hypothetical protein
MSSRCWLKTRTGNFKEYMIFITDGRVNFMRPKSAKQEKLNYELTSF